MIGLIGTILGTSILTAIAMGGGEKPKRQRRQQLRDRPRVGRQRSALRPAVTECGVFPWMPDEVDAAIESIPGVVGVDGQQVTLEVLRAVYPNTPEGEPIQWPAVPGDCPTVKAIEDRVQIRVAAVLADRAEQAADKAWYESGGR